MADTPSDIRWPPGNAVDFDDIFERLLELKNLHFPEHTARDLADPYIQILALMSALSQHAQGRMNHALLQLSPKTANSRRALISLLEVVNRPLLPIQPARGPIYAKVKNVNALATNTVLVNATQRIAPPDVIDPIFSFDESISTSGNIDFEAFHYDDSAVGGGAETSVGRGPYAAMTLDDSDAVIFGFDVLAYNALSFTLTTPLAGTEVVSWEYENEQIGPVDQVNNLGATLKFTLNNYLNSVGARGAGMSVSIRHKPSNVAEVVTTTWSGSDLEAVTSFLGQTTPSTSPSDYEVLSDWIPIPDANLVDQSVGMSVTPGQVSWNIDDLLNEDDVWYKTTAEQYRVRMRCVSGFSATSFDIDDITFDLVDPAGDQIGMYVVGAITQGIRREITIGQATGESFQFLPMNTEPISDPVSDPEIDLTVGSDTDWLVVDDFSNSDATSKHGLFREDVDEGWGILFGDGSVGELPPQGDAVKVTVRTDSTQPGDLSADAEIRALGGVGLLEGWKIFAGTSGYAEPEASTKESVLRFRASVLPQLALRAESAITATEIVQAMTGGAPFRATFTTEDGRSPFSRAFFSLENAGDRQYRVIVVGSESVADGDVLSGDLVEAEEWLNGVQVGVEIIGGRGPNNTEGIVEKFIPRALLPTVTITIPNIEGVRDQANQVITEFFKPHSRDSSEEFRWSLGGRVPIAVLFGELWAAISGRTFIEISVTDGVSTFDEGDSVDLVTFELPILDPTFDKDVNIILVEG